MVTLRELIQTTGLLALALALVLSLLPVLSLQAQTQQPPPVPSESALVKFHLGTIMPASYIGGGCLPPVPSASTTLAMPGCVGVIRDTNTASIPVGQDPAPVGPLTGGDGTYWVALHTDATTAVSGWTRQSDTHYLWIKNAPPPALTNSAMLVKVTVAGGVISTVEDFRVPASYVRSGVYDVTDPLYGGVADDTTDLGPALQVAIGAVIAQHGRTVRIPQGTYRLSSPVVVPVGGAVEITGDDWGAPAQELFEGTNQPRRGTWLHITSTAFVPFTLIGTGTTLKNLAFDHDQPAVAPGWAPLDYPYTIVVESPATCCIPQTNNDDMRLQRLFFFKATRGIHQKSVAGWQTSGLFIEDLYGQFFTSGIFLEFSAGFVKLRGIHMWVYWSADPAIYSWIDANMHAITVWRLDSALFEDVHIFGTTAAMEFIDNVHGPAQAVQMNNVVIDRARFAFYTTQNGGTVMMTNIVSNAPATPEDTTSFGMHIAGNQNRVQVVNYQCDNVALYCITVGAGNTMALNNVRTFNTNRLANGTPVFNAQPFSIFSVSGGASHILTNGSPIYFGTFARSIVPSGIQFDASDAYFGATLVEGVPTMSFTLNAFVQWIAGSGFRLGGASGEYVTGGVTKALCMQDGLILVCP